jgi:hypothetical protein
MSAEMIWTVSLGLLVALLAAISIKEIARGVTHWWMNR